MDGLIKIYKEIADIYYSDLSWEAKYDLIFGPRLSQSFCKIARSFDWCDPDADYEDDVSAFFYAAKNYMEGQ